MRGYIEQRFKMTLLWHKIDMSHVTYSDPQQIFLVTKYVTEPVSNSDQFADTRGVFARKANGISAISFGIAIW